MEFDKKVRESFYTAMNELLEPQQAETCELRLTRRDVGSIFTDGWHDEWKIVDCNPLEEYGFAAKSPHRSLSFLYAEFDKFGNRKDCEDEPRYSLNFGYAGYANRRHQERPIILL